MPDQPSLRKASLAASVTILLAAGAWAVDFEGGITEIVVNGYQEDPFQWVYSFADDYAANPEGGSGPAGAYSANPSTHVNCTANNLRAAENSNGAVSPTNPAPQPNNMALPIPARYDNPINIANGSSIGAQYGGVNCSAGFMIFPSLANGIWGR